LHKFAQGCEGIKKACLALNTPVVSGNVSLYNETNGVSVFPTPSIAMVGLNDDQNKILPSIFQKEGASLYLIGESYSEFGGSLYMKELFDKVEGKLPKIDLEKELNLWNFIISANNEGLLNCAKDVNVGGFAIALAKMSVNSGKGVAVEVSLKDDRDIFSESFSRAIVEVDDTVAFEKYAKSHGMTIDRIGKVGGDEFICNEIKRDLSKIKDIYFNRFQEVIESDI